MVDKPDHEKFTSKGWVVVGFKPTTVEHAKRNGMTIEEWARKHEPEVLSPRAYPLHSAAIQFKELAVAQGYVYVDVREKRGARK